VRFDNLDVGARCSGKSDQLVALVIVELRAGVEQEEVDLPVVECLAGRLQTGHAWRLIQSDSRPAPWANEIAFLRSSHHFGISLSAQTVVTCATFRRTYAVGDLPYEMVSLVP
jgi:hypothetical protein